MSRNRKLLFGTSTLLALFVVLEIALRLLGFNYDSFFTQAFWWKRFAANPIYERDPARFWRLRAYANSDLNPESRDTQLINSMGFRDDEFARAKAPGELRVITMGDSCTFGDGVANWETYSNVLEEMLGKALPGKKVQVINAGVPGYTSYQVRTYLEHELLPYQPDLVVVYVGFNDNVPAVNGITDAQRGVVSRSVWTIQSVFGSLRSYQLLKYLLLRVKQRMFPGVDPQEKNPEGPENQIFRVSFKDYISNFLAIKKLGEQHGFRMLLFTLPHKFTYEPERNKYIRQAAMQGHIPLLDLFAFMKKYEAQGEDLYTEDGGHPNVLGHRRVAEAIFGKMKEMGLIPADAEAPAATATPAPPTKRENIGTF
jgi:lysophospholipase L1-like esterase